jgi:hypothetical protein
VLRLAIERGEHKGITAVQRSGRRVIDPGACERGVEISLDHWVGVVGDLERGTTVITA